MFGGSLRNSFSRFLYARPVHIIEYRMFGSKLPNAAMFFGPTSALKGVGPVLQDGLKKMGITNVVDLLFHYPVSIIDRSIVCSICSAAPGDTVTLSLVVMEIISGYKLAPHRIICQDSEGSEFELVFFYGRSTQWAKTKKIAECGERILVSGVLIKARQIANPAVIVADSIENRLSFGGIEPIYPKSAAVSSKKLRSLISQALVELNRLPDASENIFNSDWIDDQYRVDNQWPTFRDSILAVHNPQQASDVNVSAAKERLAFDRLVAQQLQRRLNAKVTSEPLLLEPPVSVSVSEADRTAQAIVEETYSGKRTSFHDPVIRQLMLCFSPTMSVFCDAEGSNTKATATARVPIVRDPRGHPSLIDADKKASMVVVIDLETTGLDRKKEQIIQLSATILHDAIVESDNCPPNTAFLSHALGRDVFNAYITLHSAATLRPIITDLTGITEDMLEEHGVPLNEAWSSFESWLKSKSKDQPVFLIAHNGKRFDFQFLNESLCKIGRSDWSTGITSFLDSYLIFRNRFPWEVLDSNNDHTPTINLPPNFKLGSLYQHIMNKPMENAHNGMYDVIALAEMLEHEAIEKHWRSAANRTYFSVSVPSTAIPHSS